MRVVQVIETVDQRSGGTSSAFVGIVRALARHPGVTLTAFASGEPAGDLPHFTSTGAPGALRPGGLARVVLERLNASPHDIVHLHGLWSMDLVAIAKRAREFGVQTFWQPHGMLVERAYAQSKLKKSAFMALGLGRELARASGVIFCSPREAELSRWHPRLARTPQHIVPLPLEIALDELDAAALREAGIAKLGKGPTLGFMGRLHPVKRIDLALRAFALVRERMPSLRFVVMGDGEPEHVAQLKTLAHELGVSESVQWLGWVPSQERWALLAGLDALVLCSMFENFGFVVPEAIAVGTPTAVTQNLAMAEPVTRHGVGAAAEEEAKPLAGAIEATLARDRAAVLPAGRAWIERELSMSAVADELLGLYLGREHGGKER